jgi:hypothetical protein
MYLALAGLQKKPNTKRERLFLFSVGRTVGSLPGFNLFFEDFVSKKAPKINGF